MTVMLTHAPRSTVTHAHSARPQDWSRTVCGLEIRETWAGEMDGGIEPGIPTCKRCAANIDAGFPKQTDAARVADIIADKGAPKFAVGDRVGIITGVQTVDPWVESMGTVVRHTAPWNGQLDYIVSVNGEELLYEAWMLRTLADTLAEACKRAGVPHGTDGYPVIGDPIWAENMRGTGEIFVTLTDPGAVEVARVAREAAEISALITGSPWKPARSPIAEHRARLAERRRSMAAHPAGKGRYSSSTWAAADAWRDRALMVTGDAYRAGMPPVR